MRFESLISRLKHVKRTGPDRWQARCPAHDDRGPSLSVRVRDDGRILIHCFAGCDVYSVLSAVDMELADLFPERPSLLGATPDRRPFPAADVLRAIAFEAMVVAAAGTRLLREDDPNRERLILAVSRIQAAVAAAGLRYG